MIRNTLTLLSVLSLLAAPATPMYAQPPMTRQHLRMDADWRFLLESPVTLENPVAITTWRWKEIPTAETTTASDTTGADWKDATTGDDIFRGRRGFAHFQTTLPALPATHRYLRFAGVDDRATVYLNGTKLLYHEGWNDPFLVPLDTAWKTDSPNVLTVVVENTAGMGGITGNVALGTVNIKEEQEAFSARFDDSTWRTVHLPHDYVIEGTFSEKEDAGHGALPTSNAWYRKSFTVPIAAKGKSLWLDFDGVYRDSTVYLNGQKLGTHPCGYTPFRYDISNAVRFGERNVLAVHVNARKQEGWWYEGGGIYRHVYLTITDPVHIAPWGTFITTTLPEPGADGVAPAATVNVKTTLVVPTTERGKALTLVSDVLDPKGKVVATASTPVQATAENVTLTQAIPVTRPSLWSIEKPTLYKVRSEIRQENRPRDTVENTFGIRTIRFDAEKGFFLNGKPIKIKGTCNHQDFIGVGIAMPDSVLEWRVKKLKEMGSNAYRMSHNPPTAELLDVCDRLGMLVMDENRHLGDTEEGKASQDTPFADLHEVESMVLRDRNHPSIIMWSMCNEEGIQGSKHGADIFRAMKAVVDAADGTRPVTCAMNGGYESAVGITSVTDLQGINYNPGAYEWFHKQHPTMPLYGSETASTVGVRGIYDWVKFDRYYGDPKRSFVNAFDVNAPPWAQTAEDAWKPIAERSYVAGGYVWTGFDYKGEPTPFGWPDINSNFGILDMCGFPKDNYYYYLAWWGDKPVVHLVPHWNWSGQEGKPIRIWAFGNGDTVELLLNGKSIDTKPMPKYGHIEWEVPYTAGKLEARSRVGDKVVATDIVETTGESAALRLTTDRTKLTADGEDITMITVDVVDAQGRIVPTANPLVRFQIEGVGNIAGVGNGDPTSHEPDKASERHAFNGRCMVLVGGGERAGKIRLRAVADGLRSAELALSVASPR